MAKQNKITLTLIDGLEVIVDLSDVASIHADTADKPWNPADNPERFREFMVTGKRVVMKDGTVYELRVPNPPRSDD